MIDAGGKFDPERNWALACGARYFGDGVTHVASLPLAKAAAIHAGRDFANIELPTWAADLGIDGRLLVDSASLTPGEGEPWKRCDWLIAAFLHLTGTLERLHEQLHGPIQSYAFRLRPAPADLFDRAWANRIFLWLRRWSAHQASSSEEALFGPLPKADIVLTHDVDAIRKTPEIRFKQGVFHAWNGARAALAGRLAKAASSLSAGIRFAARSAVFETLAQVRAIENDRGLRSVLHFYAGPAGLKRKHPSRLLLDPGYDIATPYLVKELRALSEGGWTIGLHPSTAAWQDEQPMITERRRLFDASGIDPVHCRQHWLRFSWARTWVAQHRAGFLLDSTLGFNDRPGFRNGAALRIMPWDTERRQAIEIATLPMIFMDSHFYDYAPLASDERRSEMARWIGEVRAVGGEATVNWHTHTIGPDYGWGEGYRELVNILAS